MKSLRAIFAIGLLACLSACGQKGDLYFPDQKSSLVQPGQVLNWLEK